MFVCSFVPNWLLKRKELNSTDKIVYGRLCQFSGRNGKCFPKQKALARELGLSVITIRKSLKKLVDYKLIVSEQRGHGKPNLYTFLWHEWMMFDRYYNTNRDRYTVIE